MTTPTNGTGKSGQSKLANWLRWLRCHQGTTAGLRGHSWAYVRGGHDGRGSLINKCERCGAYRVWGWFNCFGDYGTAIVRPYGRTVKASVNDWASVRLS